MYEIIEVENSEGILEKHIIKYLNDNDVTCFPAKPGNPEYEKYLEEEAKK